MSDFLLWLVIFAAAFWLCVAVDCYILRSRRKRETREYLDRLEQLAETLRRADREGGRK